MDLLVNPQVNIDSGISITFKRLTKAEKREQKKAAMKESRKLSRNKYRLRCKERKNNMNADEKLEEKVNKDLAFAQLKLAMGTNTNNIYIDLSYCSTLLSDDRDSNILKEKNSLCKQLCLSYNVLKTAINPVRLTITSLKHANNIVSLLEKQGFNGWIIDKQDDEPWEISPIDKLIYLSPDADEVLHDFDPNLIYIIGGIVDRTVQKNCSLNKANEKRIRTMRLPIQEYLPNRQTHVLNIDHVLHIICDFLHTKVLLT